MIFGDIGDAQIDEPLNHVAHLRDMMSCTRLMVWLQTEECGNISMKLIRSLLGDFMDSHVKWQCRMVPCRTCVYLVVNVSNIARVNDMFRSILQPQETVEDIEYHSWSGISNMCVVPNGWAANIKANMRRIIGRELDFGSGQRIIKAKLTRHCFSLRQAGYNPDRTVRLFFLRSKRGATRDRRRNVNNGHSEFC